MKSPLPSLCLVAAVAVGGASLRAEPAAASQYPAHSIPNSELRVLPRSSTGRQYQLHIGLPESYRKDTAKRYPVVFVTDAYWDFAKISAIEGSLVYDKAAPEFITVGIGYPGDNLDYGSMRLWELSPVRFGNNENSGHAAEFLQTIEKEIIPLIDREYRTDPRHRVLAGASLGGLFTTFAMYTKPELFSGYIAATPAVVVGNDWLLGYEEAFAKTGKPIHARVYVAGGGNESPGFLGGVLRLNQRISSRHYEGMAYDFRIIDGERHAGMQYEAYIRGLRFVFAPMAPESGPATSP